MRGMPDTTVDHASRFTISFVFQIDTTTVQCILMPYCQTAFCLRCFVQVGPRPVGEQELGPDADACVAFIWVESKPNCLVRCLMTWSLSSLNTLPHYIVLYGISRSRITARYPESGYICYLFENEKQPLLKEEVNNSWKIAEKVSWITIFIGQDRY